MGVSATAYGEEGDVREERKKLRLEMYRSSVLAWRLGAMGASFVPVDLVYGGQRVKGVGRGKDEERRRGEERTVPDGDHSHALGHRRVLFARKDLIPQSSTTSCMSFTDAGHVLAESRVRCAEQVLVLVASDRRTHSSCNPQSPC
jgi:hypothetical protein